MSYDAYKRYRCLTYSQLEPLLSDLAMNIVYEFGLEVWQHKETGLYGVSEGHYDIKWLVSDLTVEMLEEYIRAFIPFYLVKEVEEDGKEMAAASFL